MKKSKMSHRLAAAITVGVMTASGSSAFAAAGGGAPDANVLVNNITTSSKGFTNLLSLLGYVGGSGLAAAGIFKLKQHVDNPAQVAMKDGVMRLAAGGALLTLPFIIATMQGSIGEGNAAAANMGTASVAVFSPGG